MGVAYYIVLDAADPGFDTFVNGKALAREAKKLQAISERLSLPVLDDFVGMSGDDIADLLGEDMDLPDLEESWFNPEEGLRLVQYLSEHIKAHPDELDHPEAVLEELAEFHGVLAKAKEIGARWHLNMDI